jgi:hypothetical protein
MNSHHMKLARELKVKVGVINGFWVQARKEIGTRKYKFGSSRKMHAIKNRMLEMVDALRNELAAKAAEKQAEATLVKATTTNTKVAKE